MNGTTIDHGVHHLDRVWTVGAADDQTVQAAAQKSCLAMGRTFHDPQFLEPGLLLVLLCFDCLDDRGNWADYSAADGRSSVYLSSILASFLASNAGHFNRRLFGFSDRIIFAGRLENNHKIT